MNQDIKLRLLIITAIIISFVIIGMSAVIYAAKVHNTDLQAIIVEQEAKIQALEKKNAELQIIVDEVEAAGAAIRAVNPDAPADEVHTLAVRQVAKAKKYGIPLELITIRDWAEADLRWLSADKKGPCGERSTAQVGQSTFRALRPNGDYNDMDQVYDAGTQYLADCYRTAQRWLGDADKTAVYRLALAFYNAGMGHRPDAALYKARVHVRRVNGIFAKAERMVVV